jgi:hypothetical protein
VNRCTGAAGCPKRPGKKPYPAVHRKASAGYHAGILFSVTTPWPLLFRISVAPVPGVFAGHVK